MGIYTSATQLVGNTPMLELFHNECRILCKIESKNPGGSVKDRVALAMIEDAEAKGLLTPDTLIVEATSGNTGIGLCAIAAARGYSIAIVMPDSMSPERQQLMAAYGAQVILTPGCEGMDGSIRKANQIAADAPRAWIPGQFVNPVNPKVHFETTGPEIWRDTQGRIDMFVAGIGTGGTVTGVGKYLKEQNPAIQILGVEPAGSPVLSGGEKGPHGIQGIGAGFIPQVLDRSILDGVIPVADSCAFETARQFAAQEGLLIGISSGAVLWAARNLAEKPENKGKTIVALFPDSGERYLSTGLYRDI